MKFTATVLTAAALAPSASAFTICTPSTLSSSSWQLHAEIRGPTEKSETLRFGWDGTQARGGAVEVAAPARMLDEIRASGETIPPECEVFNANLEMGDGTDVKFDDVMELIDKHYESQLLEFKNGNLLNKQGENEGVGQNLVLRGIVQPRQGQHAQTVGRVLSRGQEQPGRRRPSKHSQLYEKRLGRRTL